MARAACDRCLHERRMATIRSRPVACPVMSTENSAHAAAKIAPAAKAHPSRSDVALAGAAAFAKRFPHILSLDDFEDAARRHLPRPIFGYVAGAVETNSSLEDNRTAFREFGFVPRVLVDVSKRSQQTTLFGKTYASPFGFSPMGITAL